MKKSVAIYLAFFSLLALGSSCSSDDDTKIIGTPYALISSFSIDNILYPFHDVTIEGKDTIIQKLVSGEEFKFVIDQQAKEIYNIDSLTYGAKVDKVVTNLSYKGVPARYDAQEGDYVIYNTYDSIDFTSPVSVRVTSTDGTYSNYYTIKLNVHQVDPDLLAWESYALDGTITPVRLIEKDGSLYLFGTGNDGQSCVAVSQTQSAPSWAVTPLNVASVSLSSVQLFGNAFYMLADGALYSSADAIAWSVVPDIADLQSIIAVSDEGKMWVADAENILYTTDGVSFTVTESLPADFPLYGSSNASYPLATNNKIYRTMVVGYADEDMSGNVYVWSKLSTEEQWCAYEPATEEYKCPSLAGLQVLAYDNALFALGGAGIVNDKAVQPFASFFVSKDNGIVWRACKEYGLKLPAELMGCTTSFAATVTADNYMWIITPDTAWRGRINRLGF